MKQSNRFVSNGTATTPCFWWAGNIVDFQTHRRFLGLDSGDKAAWTLHAQIAEANQSRQQGHEGDEQSVYGRDDLAGDREPAGYTEAGEAEHEAKQKCDDSRSNIPSLTPWAVTRPVCD